VLQSAHGRPRQHLWLGSRYFIVLPLAFMLVSLVCLAILVRGGVSSYRSR
jgi:hypothetical protein